MSDKREATEEMKVMDERFSLEDYDGILKSLELIAEGIFTDTLRKDKADLLIKLLGTARMTLSERRKSSALSNQAVDVQPMNDLVQKSLTPTGPFASYGLPKSQ